MSLGLAKPCTVHLCIPKEPGQAVVVVNHVPLTDTENKGVAGGTSL